MKKLLIILVALIQFIFPQNDSLLSINPDTTVININNWELWIDKSGTHYPAGDSLYAGYFPKGIVSIFADGLVFGAKVKDGLSPILRMSGGDYYTNFVPGRVLFDNSGAVIGSEDPKKRKIWRVRKDYRTADLTSDAASTFMQQDQNITDWHIKSIFDQYELDWKSWPANEGAPFEDINNDGKYDHEIDIPGRVGALQTVWLVANDLRNDNVEFQKHIEKGQRIGLELHMTLWAAPGPESRAVNNAIFKEIKLIYTGLPDGDKNSRIDTMYVCQFVDGDLGIYTNDLVGWDPNQEMGYFYNGSFRNEPYFLKERISPVIGYSFLKRPTVNGDEVQMSSFLGTGAGHGDPYPNQGEARQWFNIMEGFMAFPQYPQQKPYYDWVDWEPTKFSPSGDPIKKTGDYDGLLVPPGDRYFFMSAGPFEMALGDTQEFAIGILGSMAVDPLLCINMQKYNISLLKWFYDYEITSYYVEEAEEVSLPIDFRLHQNYPNPFNPTTTIRYDLPKSSNVEVTIYNILGEKISTLVNGIQQAGAKKVNWNGSDDFGRAVSAGIYIYQIHAGDFVESRKMILMK